MRILTLDNQHYDLDHLPEEVDDMRFAILDNSNPADPDYHFIPLIFLESFNSPALVLRIGDNTIKMPMDWQVLIGEPEIGDLEVLPLTSINDRGFKVFQLGSNRLELYGVLELDNSVNTESSTIAISCFKYSVFPSVICWKINALKSPPKVGFKYLSFLFVKKKLIKLFL